MSGNRKFATNAIHEGEEPDVEGYGDVNIPIHLSTTFARKDVEKPSKGLEYSRSGNPTREAVEKKLAALENGKFGLAYSSGVAAITSVVMSFVKAGEHIIAFDDLYGGTRRLLEEIFKKQYSVDITYVDATQVGNVEQAITDKTKLILLESPTNPLLKLCDIKAISSLAQKKKILVAVDNTFTSPYFQKPLDLGASIVVHSTSKYINGHSDSIGGAVVTSSKDLYNKLYFHLNGTGCMLSPFDSYMVARGIKTLAVRMEKHASNAKALAEFLEKHARVKKVVYPGLASHPQHDLASQQMSGYGGMLTFELDGSLEDAKKFVEEVEIFSLAESLGGVESLIELPALMTHASISASEREKVGISDSLIRVSVGIEDSEDQIAAVTKVLG
tara:strand:- start:715 stop:1875 length:1161 start_codon:yes stop_codon:yes gene_type:complete